VTLAVQLAARIQCRAGAVSSRQRPRRPRNSEPSDRFRDMSTIAKPTQQVQSRGELREASSMRVAGPYTAEVPCAVVDLGWINATVCLSNPFRACSLVR